MLGACTQQPRFNQSTRPGWRRLLAHHRRRCPACGGSPCRSCRSCGMDTTHLALFCRNDTTWAHCCHRQHHESHRHLLQPSYCAVCAILTRTACAQHDLLVLLPLFCRSSAPLLRQALVQQRCCEWVQNRTLQPNIPPSRTDSYCDAFNHEAPNTRKQSSIVTFKDGEAARHWIQGATAEPPLEKAGDYLKLYDTHCVTCTNWDNITGTCTASSKTLGECTWPNARRRLLSHRRHHTLKQLTRRGRRDDGLSSGTC